MKALSQSSPQALSRQQHESLADTTLVRKRTQAKQRSDAGGLPGGPGRRQAQDATQVVEVIRRNSLLYQQQAQPGPGGQGGQGGQGGGPPPSAFNPPRKASLGTVQGLPVGPGPQQQQQQLQRPPAGAGLPYPQQPQQQQQQQQLQPQPAMQNPNPTAQRFQDRHRYALADAGPIEGAVPVSGSGGRTQSPSRPGGGVGRGGGRIVSGGTGAGAGSPKFGSPRMGDAPLPNAAQSGQSQGQGQGQSQGGVKYNTFAEMGFQSTKLEEKECVVM